MSTRAQEELEIIAEVERLLGEAARTQPGTDQARQLRDKLRLATGRRTGGSFSSGRAVDDAFQDATLQIGNVHGALDKKPEAPSLPDAIAGAQLSVKAWHDAAGNLDQ